MLKALKKFIKFSASNFLWPRDCWEIILQKGTLCIKLFSSFSLSVWMKFLVKMIRLWKIYLLGTCKYIYIFFSSSFAVWMQYCEIVISWPLCISMILWDGHLLKRKYNFKIHVYFGICYSLRSVSILCIY